MQPLPETPPEPDRPDLRAVQGSDRPLARYVRILEEEVRREIDRIRYDGIAVCDNELDAGGLSYGHPVRAAGGSVLYSVGITGLADRFRATSRESIREKPSAAAAELGKSLGFRG